MRPPEISEIDGLPALVVLEGGWRDEYREVIRSQQLAALSIRISGDNLDFLNQLEGLRGLVLNAGEVSQLTNLESLRDLETLTLNTPRRPRMSVDFCAFPKLKRLGVYWNPGFESLFACQQLEDLFVFAPPDPNLEHIGALRSLRRLELSEGRRLRALCGVEQLHRLTFLGLYFQAGLESLSGIGGVTSLETLAVENCKHIGAIDDVATLSRLKRLKLANCGEIASLKPLTRLQALEEFLAWEESRVADSDLSVLLQMPKLRKVAMKNRRGYRPTVREIEEALAARHS